MKVKTFIKNFLFLLGCMVLVGCPMPNTPEKPVNAESPEITLQPVKPDRTMFQNVTATLVIEAEVKDNGTLSYQWYKASGADETGIPVDGATSESFNPVTEETGENWYYCIVRNTLKSGSGKENFAETKSDTVNIQVIENPLPLEMVLVNGSTVTAGDSRGAFRNNTPVEVKSFYIGKTEITKNQYKAVMEDSLLNKEGISADPSMTSFEPNLYKLQSGEDDSKRPVENVTWFDAVYFCNLLSQKEGFEPVYEIRNIETKYESYIKHVYIISASVTADYSKNGYRLPTLAEWEYAARGGDPSEPEWKYVYSGADKSTNPVDGADSGLDSVGWYKFNICNNGVTSAEAAVDGTEGNGPHQVALKNANRLGLFDMSGNVAEWCYTVVGKTDKDPDGPAENEKCVFPGGFFNVPDFYCNAMPYEWANQPKNRGASIGFRVVRSYIQP